MSHEQNQRKLRMLRMLLLAAVLVGATLAQSPMDDVRNGVMIAVSSMSDMMSPGGAVDHEHSIQTDLFSINSKTKAGMGDAMRPESSRRKRRFIDFSSEQQLLPALKTIAQPHVHRTRRAPCFGWAGTGAGAADGDGADDDAEIGRSLAQRRRKAAQQRKRSTANNKNNRNKGQQNSAKGRSKFVNEETQRRRRRRRQADNMDNNMNQMREKAEHAVERMQDVKDTFKNSMTQMAQTVQETFSG